MDVVIFSVLCLRNPRAKKIKNINQAEFILDLTDILLFMLCKTDILDAVAYLYNQKQ